MTPDPAPDPRAPWEPPDLAPLKVGDRVTIRVRGECRARHHRKPRPERAGMVDAIYARMPREHVYLVFHADDWTAGFYARAELTRRPDAP